ncbi:MAG: hypothetical protein Q4P08_02395 [Eubacteriales bacterium]|nr:hypothetical protein [Eubacteriales bacterium]
MNWYGELDYFYPLNADAERLFGSPRETVLAIQSFNRILYSIMDGDRESAIEPLAQICQDFPIFAEARHLYGILLAGKGQYEEALKTLKQTALLELEPQLMDRLKFQIKELELEVKKARLMAERQRRREESLIHVKADLAKASILQKAGTIEQRDLSFASARERREMRENRRRRAGEMIQLYAEDEAEERKKTLRFAVVVGLVAIVIILFFFAFVRPVILAGQERKAIARLGWLEKEIAERSKDEEAIAELAAAYRKFLANEEEAEDQGSDSAQEPSASASSTEQDPAD